MRLRLGKLAHTDQMRRDILVIVPATRARVVSAHLLPVPNLPEVIILPHSRVTSTETPTLRTTTHLIQTFVFPASRRWVTFPNILDLSMAQKEALVQRLNLVPSLTFHSVVVPAPCMVLSMATS